jgi:bifunctional polynucleotide phosphatase/kinase
MQWNKNTEYYEGTCNNYKLNKKIAAFDLDGTLVVPKSGKKFAEDESDWTWIYNNVPEKLKQLNDEGYSIVIISNQAGISGGKQSGDGWIKKLNDISDQLNKIGVKIKVFCSTSKNKYRKPITTIWDDFFPSDFDKDSFYCGDAAGRKGDFSDTDLKFALNVGLKFYIPEHLFLGKSNTFPDVDYCFDIKNKNNQKNTKFKMDFVPKNKELIIMCGFPGSGKSYVSKYIKDKHQYEIINQDTLKTKAKCKKEAENQIKQNKSIIIDATNPGKETRKEWIDLAKSYGYTVRVIKMNTTIEHAKHNNIYRSLTTTTEQIPDMAYNMYKSKYNEPELAEGIEEIIKQDQTYPDNPKYFMYLS